MSENGTDGWLLDSGASSHMCTFQDEFVEIRSLTCSVSIRLQMEKKSRLLESGQFVSF